jgi:hypothetical protein
MLQAVNKPTFADKGAKRRPYKPVLVSLACAATELGLEPETVTQMTESGTLRYVFDISATGAKRRALRFWLRELRGHPGDAPQTVDAAVEEIAGPALFERVRTSTVSGRFQTTRTVVHKWLALGEIDGGKDQAGRQFVSRTSLVGFLKRRLCK